MTEPNERYVSRAEMAKILGMSTKTVDRFVAEGCPNETWGVRARRFLPSEVIAWARNRRSEEAA